MEYNVEKEKNEAIEAIQNGSGKAESGGRSNSKNGRCIETVTAYLKINI